MAKRAGVGEWRELLWFGHYAELGEPEGDNREKFAGAGYLAKLPGLFCRLNLANLRNKKVTCSGLDLATLYPVVYQQVASFTWVGHEVG